MPMIRDNFLHLRQRIEKAALRVGRDPAMIKLVAVTKSRDLRQIHQALEFGVTDIGENRIQEALIKYRELTDQRPIKWHMVGHLQTNKAKEAVGIFDYIHSLDSLHLAEELDKQAGRVNKLQDVLLEVNVSGETAKFGVPPQDAPTLVKEISRLGHLRLQGLMTVAPISDDPEKSRPHFRALRELKDKINQLTNNPLTVLSMGMSDDFEVAIEEGADFIRLGRAIFEG